MTDHTPRPGKFTAPQTPAGHHLLLTGANGEPVAWTETYTDATGPVLALDVVVRTVLAAAETALAVDPDAYRLTPDGDVSQDTVSTVVGVLLVKGHK